MSLPRSRIASAVGLAVLCLVVFDGWELWQWTVKGQELVAEQEQLMAVSSLAHSIRELRRSPEKIEATARSADALAKLIETSAQQVGLATDRIVHVAPSEPRRIGNSPYLEQLTGVELRDVSLKQLVDLTQAIAQAAPRLAVPAVAIRIPPGDSNSAIQTELWNIDLTLTGHLYQPKMPP